MKSAISSFFTQLLCSTFCDFNAARGAGTDVLETAESFSSSSKPSSGISPGATASRTEAANLKGDAVEAITHGVASPVSRR